MLKNHLKIVLRHLRRAPGYTLINVLGLALGMACCLIIVLFVRDELSYDRFHADAHRIYRVVDGSRSTVNTSAALAPALVREFPGVERAVRISPRYPEVLAAHQGESGYDEHDGSAGPPGAGGAKIELPRRTPERNSATIESARRLD